MGHVHGSVTPISVKYDRRNLNSQCMITGIISAVYMYLNDAIYKPIGAAIRELLCRHNLPLYGF